MAHPLNRNFQNLFQVARWSLLILPVALLVGSFNAFFLWLLSEATQARIANPWLIYLLPVAGLAIV